MSRCLLLMLALAPSIGAAEPPTPFAGEVVVSSDAAKPGPMRLALKAEGGKTLAIIDDAKSRLLFEDAALRGRPVRLIARLEKDGTRLRVERVQTVKDGKVFDVDYWCEVCQLAAAAPGKCLCCGADVERRELAAKSPPLSNK